MIEVSAVPKTHLVFTSSDNSAVAIVNGVITHLWDPTYKHEFVSDGWTPFLMPGGYRRKKEDGTWEGVALNSSMFNVPIQDSAPYIAMEGVQGRVDETGTLYRHVLTGWKTAQPRPDEKFVRNFMGQKFYPTPDGWSEKPASPNPVLDNAWRCPGCKSLVPSGKTGCPRCSQKIIDKEGSGLVNVWGEAEGY